MLGALSAVRELHVLGGVQRGGDDSYVKRYYIARWLDARDV